MLGEDVDKRGEALREVWQCAAQRQRQLRILALRERVERQAAHPCAQHQGLVPRPRACGAQRVTQLGERSSGAHGLFNAARAWTQRCAGWISSMRLPSGSTTKAMKIPDVPNCAASRATVPPAAFAAAAVAAASRTVKITCITGSLLGPS